MFKKECANLTLGLRSHYAEATPAPLVVSKVSAGIGEKIGMDES